MISDFENGFAHHTFGSFSISVDREGRGLLYDREAAWTKLSQTDKDWFSRAASGDAAVRRTVEEMELAFSWDIVLPPELNRHYWKFCGLKHKTRANSSELDRSLLVFAFKRVELAHQEAFPLGSEDPWRTLSSRALVLQRVTNLLKSLNSYSDNLHAQTNADPNELADTKGLIEQVLEFLKSVNTKSVEAPPTIS